LLESWLLPSAGVLGGIGDGWQEAVWPPPCEPGAPGGMLSSVIPPPNGTGQLHKGHMLDHTVMDTGVRWHRMKVYPTFGGAGADHASIAVHVVVERELAKEVLTRQQLGRDAFLGRTGEVVNAYRGRIVDQLRSMGFSLDWSRYVFTMDPGPAQAVRTVFKQLYDRGLIYRANRMVHWDPVNQTTVSDLEVDQVEEDGHLWYIRYAVESESVQSITVATTRPETSGSSSGQSAVTRRTASAGCRATAARTGARAAAGRARLGTPLSIARALAGDCALASPAEKR